MSALLVAGLSIPACNDDSGVNDIMDGGAFSGGGAQQGAGGAEGSGGRAGLVGGTAGDASTGGSGGCVREVFELDEHCAHYPYPRNPLHDPAYVCDEDGSKLPEDSTISAYPPTYTLKVGCGMANWFRTRPNPPTFEVTSEAETGELLGCKYWDDVPVPGQCGDSFQSAGEQFECDKYDRYFCVQVAEANVGGAGGRLN